MIYSHRCSRFCVLLVLHLVFVVSYSAKCQVEFWGISPKGGKSGQGTVFKYTDGVVQNVHDFYSPHPGNSPYAVKLLEASNSKLYGLTNHGGIFDSGVLFEYDVRTNGYRVRHNFEPFFAQKGFSPLGSLIQASNGKLYGTAYGGSNGAGVIFEYDLISESYLVVHNFESSTGYGSNPSVLVEGDNSKLYGVAALGGATDGGVIFEFDINTKSYARKINFSVSTGFNPRAGLMRASDGRLYGVTREGGNGSQGTLYEYDPVSNQVVVKIHFGETLDGVFRRFPGGRPESLPVEHPNGKFYGVTPRGGGWGVGVLYEWNPVTNAIAAQFQFGPGEIPGGNASTPFGQLAVASNGNLYGMTTAGDVYSTLGGFLYEYNIATDIVVAKESIGSSRSTVIELSDGMLYGLTQNGGNLRGELFRYNPGTEEFTSLFSFDDAPFGGRPFGSLAQGFDDKFYGMAHEGGSFLNGGILFEVDPSNGTYTRRHDFSPFSGPSRPKAGLTLHPNGKLYAITWWGGNVRSYGTILEYDPALATITHVNHLDEPPGGLPINGQEPLGELTLADDGKFYAVTSRGGANSLGVILEYDPFHHTIKKRFDFSTAFGSQPKGSLTLAYNGKLYGMTTQGGASSFGVLFEFDPETGLVSKKGDFTSRIGIQPEGKLLAASDGALYGVSNNGGYTGSGAGIIFKYHIASGVLSAAHYFTGSPGGGGPLGGGLVESPDGKLFGVTRGAGTKGMGVIFEFDPVSFNVSTRHSFDGFTGTQPEYVGLTFKKQHQTINVANSAITATYGDAPLAPMATASSGLPVRYVSADPAVAVIENNVIVLKSAGTVTIYALQLGSKDFLPAPMEEIALTIGKAPLVARAKDVSRNYGGDNPTLEIEFTGFLNDDSQHGIDVFPEASTLAEKYSGVGEYEISLSGGLDDKYVLNNLAGTLTIGKASLKVIANDKTKSYGDENPELTFAYEGFAGSENETDLDIKPTVHTSAASTSKPGVYKITPEGGHDANYSFICIEGNLTIEKANLKVTAKNTTRPYGDVNPSLDVFYEGFVAGEDDSMLDEPPTAWTSASEDSDAGVYLIELTGGTDDSYSFILANGLLTIGKAPLRAVASDQSKGYKQVNPALVIYYEGFVGPDNESSLDETPDVSTDVKDDTPPGTYVISVDGGVDNNYEYVHVAGVFTVTKAEQTITFLPIPSKAEGEGSFLLSATTSSGLPVTFASNDSEVAEVTGNSVIIMSAGSVEITASQAGNENYFPAIDVSQILTIIPVTGVEDDFAERLDIYPNPTHGKFHIANAMMFEKLFISNALGQVMLTMTDVTDHEAVDVSYLPAGVYKVIAWSPTCTINLRFIKL